MLLEDVEIARAEDKGVEDLGYEGDTFCRAVSMDGEDENDLGGHVREISQDTEDLEMRS